jgi:hypothetical protein
MTGTSGREMGEAMRAYQQHSAPAPAAPFGDRAIPARGQQPAFTRSPDSYQAWTGTGASPATDDVALQDRPVKGAPSGRVATAMAQSATLDSPALPGGFRQLSDEASLRLGQVAGRSHRHARPGGTQHTASVPRQPGSQAADHQWDRSAGRALSRPS